MLFAVIDEKQKESIPEHETQISTIRWHLSEGLFSNFDMKVYAK